MHAQSCVLMTHDQHESDQLMNGATAHLPHHLSTHDDIRDRYNAALRARTVEGMACECSQHTATSGLPTARKAPPLSPSFSRALRLLLWRRQSETSCHIFHCRICQRPPPPSPFSPTVRMQASSVLGVLASQRRAACASAARVRRCDDAEPVSSTNLEKSDEPSSKRVLGASNSLSSPLSKSMI